MGALACVAGLKRGRGNLGARERAREKGKERCKETIVRSDSGFFGEEWLRDEPVRTSAWEVSSDSERENSDWSELIKCQSST